MHPFGMVGKTAFRMKSETENVRQKRTEGLQIQEEDEGIEKQKNSRI